MATSFGFVLLTVQAENSNTKKLLNCDYHRNRSLPIHVHNEKLTYIILVDIMI